MWLINGSNYESSISSNNLDGCIKKHLLPYQLATLETMEKFETRNIISDNFSYMLKTNIGILSNKVGSGKTLIIIGLILRNVNNCLNPDDDKNITEILSSKSISEFQSSITISGDFLPNNKTLTNSSLVVCPYSIINQWETEIRETSLKALFLKKVKDFEEITLDIIKTFDVVVCTNTLYNKFIHKLSFEIDNLVWDRVIFDEADSIKSINSEINSRFFWMITATSVGLRFVNKSTSMIGRIIDNFNNIDLINIRCKDEFIDHFNKFKIEKFFIECATPYFLNILRNHINPEIISLINAGEIEEAVKKIGEIGRAHV